MHGPTLSGFGRANPKIGHMLFLKAYISLHKILFFGKK